MKILLLNPPFLPGFSRSQRSPAVTKSGTIYYPIWLSYAAGLLEKHGHEIKLLDAAAEKMSHAKTLEAISEFSCRMAVIDTSTPSIYNDLDFANKMKQALPHCKIILVGPHVTALPEETLLLCESIDYIARGEYDHTLVDIASGIKDGDLDIERIPGVTFRSQGSIKHTPEREPIPELDKLPFVSAVYKKHLNIRNYFFAASLYPQVQILTARGCPFKCFFCLWPQAFQGRSYRARSPQNVVEEFAFIKKGLPRVKGVVIEDDTFTVDKLRVRQICELLIKKGVKLPWNANVRTDLDLETMKLMKKAGCYLIITGVESTTGSILEGIDKGLKEEHFDAFFANAKKAGLLVHAAFMAGNPGETKETLKKNLLLAKSVLPDTIQFFPLIPYPGTKAYQWAKDNGYLKISGYRDYLDDTGLHNTVLDLPGLSAKELVRWCDYSRRSYYLSPAYLWYKTKQLFSKPESFIRTIKALWTFRRHIFRGA